MEKVAANYSVLLVELRALALAVLAVQVCCRCVLCAVIAGSTGIVSKRSKSSETVRYCCKTGLQAGRDLRKLAACKDTSQQTRNAHAAV